ncbi:MAG: hypothetical protein RLZZ241_1098 [Bacteroidota bacterium]
MNLKKIRLLYLAMFLCSLTGLKAEVKLPALVGDHMVLQRDAAIRIWGWAEPGERVTVQLKNQKKSTRTGTNGTWEIFLNPEAAGGPYTLTVRGTNSIVLNDILFGDVWLASGQSNMEWSLQNTNNADREIALAKFPEIRLFTVKREFAFEERQDVQSQGWQLCSPETAARFSAVAYLFGRELHQTYQVPIGLIHSSWGGTTAQTWTSPEGLKEIPRLNEASLAIQKISESDYEKYIADLAAWKNNEGALDRGRQTGKIAWSARDLNTEVWPELNILSNWYDVPELQRFGGTVWFRKSISIPEGTHLNHSILGLGNVIESDSVYVNGNFIGANSGYNPKRVYSIPSGILNPGENIIVLRLTGSSEFGGLFGSPEDLFLQADGLYVPLAGHWKYQTAPDLNTMPVLPSVSDFSTTMPQSPNLLYNTMIKPISPFIIKGVIWYQGESNAHNFDEALEYRNLFPAMIQDWRQLWKQEFPFLFVQLANFMTDANVPSDTPWARLRESQAKTLQLPKTGMAVTIDIGDPQDIHPRNKQDVAHRLALAARGIAYEESIVYSGPVFESAKAQGKELELTFSHTGSGLHIKDNYGYIKGFALAAADGIYHWAQARLVNNRIVIQSDAVANPVAVRYNWGNSPDGNLYNAEGLPAVPFEAQLKSE